VEGEVISHSAGVAELVTRDDAESFAGRADAGLQQAKLNGRGTLVLESGQDVTREALVLRAASGEPGRRG
jgi:hypothetical protein